MLGWTSLGHMLQRWLHGRPEHLRLLEDADRLKRWRAAHPLDRLDLADANLRGIDLRKFDLSAGEETVPI